MSSLTATSITLSWTQPVGGLTVDIYRVTLTTTSAEMCSGVSHTREETTISTSIVIDGLEENSIYTVNISAVNNESNAINTTSGLTITTPAAGMLEYYNTYLDIVAISIGAVTNLFQKYRVLLLYSKILFKDILDHGGLD